MIRALFVLTIVSAVACGGPRPPFDATSANAAVGNVDLASCTTGAPLDFHATLVFANDGSAESAIVDGGPLAGTPAAACVEKVLRGAKVAPFDGPHATVRRSFHMK